MLTVVALAIVVPSLFGVTYLGLRGIRSKPLVRSLVHARGADARGIALQTIIIVVVLLAIAGAVAAVLLTRAGTETDRLEGETDRWTDIESFTGCEIANGRPSTAAIGGTFAAATNQGDFVACWPPL